MLLILFFAAGCALGWRRATQRGGATADKVQWSLAHGFAGVVVGAVVTLLLGFAGFSTL